MNGRLGVKITFDDRSAGEANRAATELRRMLLDDAGGNVTASIEKDNQDSQDVGSVLVLLFGTSAAVTIAQGIRAFLAKRPAHRDGLTIRTADGDEIVATGAIASKLDAPALVEALLRQRAKA
jgi:hypothetical protein